VDAYFFDSSAIVKGYIKETGSSYILNLVEPLAGNFIYGVSIAEVEVVSAISRRLREGSLTSSDAVSAITVLHYDFVHCYRIIAITGALIDRAIVLTQTHFLRAYDAMQLAAALEINERFLAAGQAITLVSADVALNNAARTEGLMVEDPNLHP
jgi:predicted nucleic acid-binding protein